MGVSALRRLGGLTHPSWEARGSAPRSRSNYIRNNSMQGAVAGVIGSGGDWPTNWVLALLPTGITTTISGPSTENKIEYIGVRFAGTPGSTATARIYTEGGANVIAAEDAQTWTHSNFLGLAAGTTTNWTGRATVQMLNGSGGGLALLSGDAFQDSLTGRLARFSTTSTLTQALTEYIRPYIGLSFTSGQAVDFTIRIGRPMLHQGAAALSPLRTSDAARLGVHSSRRERV